MGPLGLRRGRVRAGGALSPESPRWHLLLPCPNSQPGWWLPTCYVLGASLSIISCSVAQSCLTVCNPMDCSTLGLPVHHQLLELAQTHVHGVGHAIQPSHLSPPSPTAFNLSQHQSLFQWVGSSHQVAKVIVIISPSNQYSGLSSIRIDWFDLPAVQGTLKTLLQHHNSQVSILQCSAFFISNSHIHTWLLEKAWLWLYGPLWAKWCLCFLKCCLGLSWLSFQGTSIF